MEKKPKTGNRTPVRFIITLEIYFKKLSRNVFRGAGVCVHVV